MRTIHKYPIPLSYNFPILMPQRAKILTFQKQDCVLYIWAEVETDNYGEQRRFSVLGTGHVVPDYAKYIGTVQDGTCVWHLYEMSEWGM